jgi:hypothetical protein
LIDLQKQIKAIHETRHAGYLRETVAAQEEAEDLMALADEGSPMAGLFADLYARRIGSALSRKDRNAELARAEAAKIVSQTVRGNIIARYYQEVLQQEERLASEKELLETVSRQLPEK